LIIEWNLLIEEENEIKSSFEFDKLYRNININKNFLFNNLFINHITTHSEKSGLKSRLLINEKLKSLLNQEMIIRQYFEKKFNISRIKFIEENKVYNLLSIQNRLKN